MRLRRAPGAQLTEVTAARASVRLGRWAIVACVTALATGAVGAAATADASRAERTALAPSGHRQAPVPLRRLVGQLLVGRFFGPVPSASFVERVRRGELGGVILFRDNFRNAAGLKALVQQLQRTAAEGGNPPLLIAVDQEGGRIRRLTDAPPFVSAAEMGRAASTSAVERVGFETGTHLRRAGVTVNLAPVLDTPSSPASFLRERAFSSNPAVVSVLGPAFASGVQRARVAATAKHFPGLGAAPGNTDRQSVVVSSSPATLHAHLAPFRTAVRRGVRLVMLSNARYAVLSPLPAVLSPRIVKTILRREVGFKGVVITDTMSAPGVGDRPGAARQALAAGVDVLLYSEGESLSAAAYETLLAAAGSGSLPRWLLEPKYRRVLALKRWLHPGASLLPR